MNHDVFDDYEVFRLPYRSNLRDKIYVKYGEDGFSIVRRALTFLELLLQPFLEWVIPYRNIREFSLQYLRQNTDISHMVVSGGPFNFFRFAFALRRETGIRWIADYRDAWTTSEINLIGKGVLHRVINRLERHYEKQWVGTASLVTASSAQIADDVCALVGVEGHALYNGSVSEDFDNLEVGPKFEDFTISYIGTLYEGQRVEVFCEAFKRIIDLNRGISMKLRFLGLGFDEPQRRRIERLLVGYEGYYECTPRLERRSILIAEKQSHLLLHVAWDQHSGIIASKIYEYIASGTFILVTPTDKGAIEEIVAKSKCGICTETVDETYKFLDQEYRNYLAGKFRVNDLHGEAALQFSRKRQAGRLAGLLDRL